MEEAWGREGRAIAANLGHRQMGIQGGQGRGLDPLVCLIISQEDISQGGNIFILKRYRGDEEVWDHVSRLVIRARDEHSL